MARKGKKRLTIDLPEELFEILVEMSHKYHINMTAYVTLALIDRFKKEDNLEI